MKVDNITNDVHLKQAIYSGLSGYEKYWGYREDNQSEITESIFDSIRDKEQNIDKHTKIALCEPCLKGKGEMCKCKSDKDCKEHTLSKFICSKCKHDISDCYCEDSILN